MITSTRPSAAPPPARRIVRQYAAPKAPDAKPPSPDWEAIYRQERARHEFSRRNHASAERARLKQIEWLERRVARLVEHCRAHGIKVPVAGKKNYLRRRSRRGDTAVAEGAGQGTAFE